MENLYDRVYDPNSGHCYYLNKVTGEARWQKPLLLRGDDDIECVCACVFVYYCISSAKLVLVPIHQGTFLRGGCGYRMRVCVCVFRYKPQRRPGVEEYLSTQQRVVSQLWDSEALAAAKLIFGKPVRFVRLSLQQMRADSTAIVAGDMGEVVEGGTESDSVIVMTEHGVRVRTWFCCVGTSYTCQQ